VLVTERRESRIAARVPESVPLFVVPHAIVDLLVGFNFHQGVLACGTRLPPPRLEDVVQQSDSATLVVCPRLDNPENLGAILRLADVFGVDAVLAGPGCPDPLSRRVLRVSMGMSLRVPTIVPIDLDDEVRRLRDDRAFEFVAAVADSGAIPFDRYERPTRI